RSVWIRADERHRAIHTGIGRGVCAGTDNRRARADVRWTEGPDSGAEGRGVFEHCGLACWNLRSHSGTAHSRTTRVVRSVPAVHGSSGVDEGARGEGDGIHRGGHHLRDRDIRGDWIGRRTLRHVSGDGNGAVAGAEAVRARKMRRLVWYSLLLCVVRARWAQTRRQITFEG